MESKVVVVVVGIVFFCLFVRLACSIKMAVSGGHWGANCPCTIRCKDQMTRGQFALQINFAWQRYTAEFAGGKQPECT